MNPFRVTLLVAFLLARTPALAEDAAIPTLALGSSAPAFSLPGVDGKTWSLNDFKSSKLLAVIFTCTHCPTAQYYEDRIIKLVEDYRGRSVSVVAINPNDPKSVRLDELGYTDLADSFEEMKIRAAHKKFNFPYLFDGETETISKQYGPVATPHAFLFDADRKLRYVGRIDDSERPEFVKTNDLQNAIEALLAGKEPAVKQTKSFGCSIKWGGKLDSVQRYMAKLDAEKAEVEPIDAVAMKKLRQNDSGKLRLVNFWATWCGPCITEFPELITINRMYRQRAFEMVTVAANYPDEKAAVLRFLNQQHASTRNYLFGTPEKYSLIEAFDPAWSGALPFTMLIDASGKVVYRHEGPVDDLELKRKIVQTLKEDRFK